MHDAQSKVAQFHNAMGQPAPDSITFPLSREDVNLRVELILEEFLELREALSNEDLPATADALADLLYVVYGAAVEMGLDMEDLFDEVHRANMDKVGGPVRWDGKQLKPNGWEPPDIEGVLAGMG